MKITMFSFSCGLFLLVFRKKDLYLIITQKFTFLISWNPADFMKSGGFHPEIRRISKDQLPGMVSPMFFILTYSQHHLM